MAALVGGELDDEAAPDAAGAVPGGGGDGVGAGLGGRVELGRGGGRAALDEVKGAALCRVCGEVCVAGDGRAGELFGAA